LDAEKDVKFRLMGMEEERDREKEREWEIEKMKGRESEMCMG
jgi:hypothetical protein